MKRIFFLFFLFPAVLCAPHIAGAQVPQAEIFRQEGIASWYGPEFDGRPTASGEIFNSALMTAAHPSLPFGTFLVVTNQHNNKKVIVRVNDRGPFAAARIIDLSRAAAEQLDMLVTGTAPVSIESVERIAIPSTSQPAAPGIAASPAAQTAPVNQAPVVSAAPTASVFSQPPVNRAKLIPDISPVLDRLYRLQVGSYQVAKNAVDAFEKLKNAGFNPAYERNGDFYRVVISGIQGNEVLSITEKLWAIGFREVLIREEPR